MKTPQHTPKLWTQGSRVRGLTFNASNIYDANGNCIATVTGVPLHSTLEELLASDNEGDREGMANARLISAAPELLSALKEVLNEFRAWQPELETDEPTKALCDIIKAAIAKAEVGASKPEPHPKGQGEDIRIQAMHEGRNPQGIVLTAGRSGDTGNYQEIAVGAYKGDKRIMDVLVGLNDTGELRVLVTSDGDGDGDHPIAVYPQRNKDEHYYVEPFDC